MFSNVKYVAIAFYIYTPGRRQSKTLLTVDERGSRITRNSVFDCQLSPVRRQMTIENSVSNDLGLNHSRIQKILTTLFSHQHISQRAMQYEPPSRSEGSKFYIRGSALIFLRKPIAFLCFFSGGPNRLPPPL